MEMEKEEPLTKHVTITLPASTRRKMGEDDDRQPFLPRFPTEDDDTRSSSLSRLCRTLRRQKTREEVVRPCASSNGGEDIAAADSPLSKLGHSIRTGNTADVEAFVADNDFSAVVGARFKFEICVRRVGHKGGEGYVRPETQPAALEVGCMQLAVVSRQTAVVELLLSLARRRRHARGRPEPHNGKRSRGGKRPRLDPGQEPGVLVRHGGEDLVWKLVVGSPAVSVQFKEDARLYAEGDRMLHGSTALHLAARFHADSLKLFLEFLRDDDVSDAVSRVAPEEADHWNRTPLHCAASNPDPSCLRLLLDRVDEVDVRDYRGHTPLHIACQASAEENVRLLLGYDADPNAEGRDGATPLHRSTSARVVRMLLRHGADPCRATGSGPARGSALELLLDKNPSGAKVILDESVHTNGQDLTSKNLILVFDLEVLKQSDGDKAPAAAAAAGGEMALHRKLSRARLTNLLEHPLCETLLVLKCQLLRKYAVFNILLQVSFALFLSFLAALSTTLRVRCPADVAASSVTDCFEQGEPAYKWSFWALYFVVCGLTAEFALREVTQAYAKIGRYFSDFENYLEIGLIVAALGYLATLLINVDVSPHFGAVAVLLAWFDFTLLMGRFPSIGVYIYMAIHVLRMLVGFFFLFEFIIFAFALAFHILLPQHVSFDKPLAAVIKILVMGRNSTLTKSSCQNPITKYGHPNQ